MIDLGLFNDMSRYSIIFFRYELYLLKVFFEAVKWPLASRFPYLGHICSEKASLTDWRKKEFIYIQVWLSHATIKFCWMTNSDFCFCCEL